MPTIDFALKNPTIRSHSQKRLMLPDIIFSISLDIDPRHQESPYLQGCSQKFYQPGNHKLQAGSWLKKSPSREAANFFNPPPPLQVVRGYAPLENFENQKSQIG